MVFTILEYTLKGAFNLCLGHYVIAVAIMGTAPSPDSSVLQDHVQPVVSTLDSGIATAYNYKGKVETFFCCYILFIYHYNLLFSSGWSGINVFTFLYAMVLDVSNIVLCLI